MRLTAIDRLHSALTGPARERNVLLVLAAYVVVWTAYGAIAKSSQGLHPDMTEIVAWSRDLSLGYLKHPPLAAGIVWLWFSVMPLAEWSYYLLAMLMPAIALWFAWRASADVLDADKRAVGLALLMLVPFFNFHALKFNVNTVLIPTWAATTVWFLRSYVTRSTLYAVLAGLGAAACMLGKYWSVFLLAGLALAALIDNRRSTYLKSAAPWITVVVGLVVLAPHLLWLKQHDFAPFGYALTIHGAKPLATTLKGVLGYLGGSIGYIAAPLLVTAFLVWRSRANLADILWPRERERRLTATALWASFLLPAVGALASGTELTSLWSMPAWTLLSVVLLSSPRLRVRAIDTRRILLAAAVLPLVMLLASPVIAVMTQQRGPAPAGAQGRLLANEVERFWHQTTPRPLRFVGGEVDLAYGVTAYAADRPRALTDMPPPEAAELARSGAVIVCFADDAGCRAAAARAATAPGSSSFDINIVRNYLGVPGEPRRYSVTILPPRPN